MHSKTASAPATSFGSLWSEHPFRWHIGALFAAMLCAVGIAITFFNFLEGRKILLEATNDAFVRTMREIEGDLERVRRPVETVVDWLSRSPLIDATSLEARSRWFAALAETLNLNPAIESIYVGYDNGDFIQLLALRDDRDRARLGAPPRAAYALQSIERAGLVPGEQVSIALDIAASDFGRGGRYTLGLERRELDSDGLIELLLRWCDRFPIASIEDPLAEDDPAAFARFTAAVGHRLQVVGDDFLVSDAGLLRQAVTSGAANTVLLKPNQRGTLTETLQCWQAAKESSYAAIVSARSGETEDTTIVDLAIGWQVGQLKVGSFARSERMAKWNAVLRIEDEAGAAAGFAGAAAFGRSPAPRRA